MDGKIIQEVEKSMSGLKVLQAKSITRGLTFGFDVTPLFCTISVDNISALIGAIIFNRPKCYFSKSADSSLFCWHCSDRIQQRKRPLIGDILRLTLKGVA